MGTAGFVVPSWLVYGVALVLSVAIAVALVKAWTASRRSAAKWHPLPNYYPNTSYRAPTGVSPVFIVEALQKSESCLHTHTKWTAAQTASALIGVSVFVVDSESWIDIWGRKVAGLQLGSSIQVGKSLAALCHEMAHLMEEVLDNEIDFRHSTWETDGITRALADFDKWLKQRAGAQDPSTLGVSYLVPRGVFLLTLCRYRKR